MAFLLIAMLVAAHPAQAQSNPIADMTGQEIIENLQSGNITAADVAANIDLPDATPFNVAKDAIDNIANIPDVSVKNLGGLIESLGAEDLIPRDIGLIRDLASDFSVGNISTEFQNNIIENIGLGNISPRVAQFTNLVADTTEAIDSINGIIDSLESFDGFDMSSLGSVLQDALGEGIGRIENVAGLVTENLDKFKETIDEMITQAVDPAIFNGLVENIANGIIPSDLLDTINDSLPNFDDLKDALDPAQFFQDLGVMDDLQNFVGDAQELLETVAGISQIQNVLQGLEGIDLDAVLDALPTEALDKLLDEFGSLGAIKEALEGILGDNVKPMGDKCEAQCSQCSECPARITANHERIRAHVTAEFVKHRNWIVGEYFTNYIRPALAIMTSQLTTIGIQQVQIIGSFFDAKHQLETQRLFQTMTAQAHKDYHPSEGLCVIGTNSRSLANSYKRAEMAQLSLSQRMMDRQLGSGSSISSQGGAEDKKNRLEKFISTYCNPNDHAGGLFEICNGASAANRERENLDINYTKTLGGRLTVGLDPIEEGSTTPSEEDIYALSANLFANDTLPIIPAAVLVDNDGTPNSNVNYLLDIRALAAKRSVAQNSFAAIAGMKSQGDGEAGPFLKAVLKEVGIDARDIEARLGKNPSYHAQMEILTKDIYQQPTFYTNLYDKPVNVERKSAALLALELMQDRDIYNSLLRSEAVLATLIEVMLEAEHERISNELTPVVDFDIDARGPQ